MKKSKAFCVNCGRKTDKLIDGLCAKCYSEKGGLSHIDGRLRMEMCPVCGSIKHRGKWIEEDLYEGMRRLIIESTFFSPDITWKRVDVDFRRKGKTLYDAAIKIEGEIDGNEVEENLYTEILVEKTVCPRCSRKAGKYYEAIIQIRTDERGFDEGEMESIERYLTESVNRLGKEGRDVFIADRKETRGGVDFYISDKRVARSLVHQMREKFGGEIKSSAKLFGMKDGVKRYRMTYLLRLHKYRKDDIVVKDEKIFYIKWFSSSGVKAVDLKNWKEYSFRHKEIVDFDVLRKEDFVREAVVVSKRGREVQILDPDTYKTVDTVIPMEIELDKTVKIVKYRDEIFLIPPSIE